jgi:hypothetical protein
MDEDKRNFAATSEEELHDQVDRTDLPLISAQSVKGTAVYNTSGDKLGSVETVMIDKISGQVVYAVMSFGGFLGIGERYHQLPWDALDYDESVDGYRVDLPREALERAPSYSRDELDRFDYASGGAAINEYYGADRTSTTRAM